MSKNPETCTDQDDVQIDIIHYMQYCIIHCKTPEQMQHALKKLNEYLEKLSSKKALNTCQQR